MLEEHNYKIVNSAGAQFLKEEHNFILVLTPERLLYLLISNPEIDIDYLFIDEAHKISENEGRSAFYYKVVDILSQRENRPHIVFASPNILNPNVYLNIIPQLENSGGRALSSSYSPVSQLKFLIDVVSKTTSIYNDKSKCLDYLFPLQGNATPGEIIKNICNESLEKQSLVYCNSKDTAIEMAIEFARDLPEKHDPRLDALANEIKSEIHDTYYLIDLIKKGIAYHVGYLPNYIRNTIEKCYRDHLISVIFCTSTLVEGVNLPADNLFVMSYKNGLSEMSQVDFRNLIGRVGRIQYNLYGNVFIIRHDENQSLEK